MIVLRFVRSGRAFRQARAIGYSRCVGGGLLMVFRIQNVSFRRVVMASKGIVTLHRFQGILGSANRLRHCIFVRPARFSVARCRGSLVRFINVRRNGMLLSMSFPLRPFRPLGCKDEQRASLYHRLFDNRPNVLLRHARGLRVRFVRFFYRGGVVLL